MRIDVPQSLFRRYVRSLLLEDEARRKQLAKDLAVTGTKERNPVPSNLTTGEEHVKLVKQARSQGRDLKKAFAKSADRAFLDSLVTVHWFNNPKTMKSFLEGSFSSRDELSASAYLPGEVKGAGKFGDYGILIKGYITLLANDMDQLYTGGTLAYEEVFPDMKKQSGINKGVQSTYDPEAYEEYKILVLDEEDWDPSFGGFRSTQNNEALVDNWSPMALIVPDGPLTRLPPEWHPGSERTEPKVPDTTEAEEWEKLAEEAGLDIQVMTHIEFTARGWV